MTLTCDKDLATANSSAREGIEQLLDRFAASWNEGDTDGIALCFTGDGDLQSTEGELVRGREAIAAMLREEWQRFFLGSRAAIAITSVRSVSLGFAFVDAAMSISSAQVAQDSQALSMRIVILAKFFDTSWWFEAVRPYVLYVKTIAKDEDVCNGGSED